MELIQQVNELNIPIRDKVALFDERARNLPQRTIEVKHYFSRGVYAREIFIPKDTMLSGKIHKFENLNIVSKGKISVLMENGWLMVEAPYTIVSPPGTKRLALAHEDTVWTTIIGTELRDVEKIEDQFLAVDYSQVDVKQIDVEEVKQVGVENGIC